MRLPADPHCLVVCISGGRGMIDFLYCETCKTSSFFDDADLKLIAAGNLEIRHSMCGNYAELSERAVIKYLASELLKTSNTVERIWMRLESMMGSNP